MVGLFLKGKGVKLLNQVSQKMKQASVDLDYELAASYRDQLIGLRTIQEGMVHNLIQIWMSYISSKKQRPLH